MMTFLVLNCLLMSRIVRHQLNRCGILLLCSCYNKVALVQMPVHLVILAISGLVSLLNCYYDNNCDGTHLLVSSCL